MVKAILFDFAGVIGTEWKWQSLTGKPAPAGKSWPDYVEKLNHQVDGGIITNQEFVRRIAKLAHLSEKSIWERIFPMIVINKELVRFIEKLKKKYKIGLLSNFTHEWLEEILEKHNLAPYFDSVYISSLYGMRKPESGAFRKALEPLGVKPEEAAFVDDRAEHIGAASALGIRSFLYTSYDQLKQDFKKSGIFSD